jgi:hypothetical protein
MKNDFLPVIGNALIPSKFIRRSHERCAYLPYGFAGLRRKNKVLPFRGFISGDAVAIYFPSSTAGDIVPHPDPSAPCFHSQGGVSGHGVFGKFQGSGPDAVHKDAAVPKSCGVVSKKIAGDRNHSGTACLDFGSSSATRGRISHEPVFR